MEQFARYMFQQLGTRVFILSAAKDQADDVVVSW
jgi:hypothetical protein